MLRQFRVLPNSFEHVFVVYDLARSYNSSAMSQYWEIVTGIIQKTWPAVGPLVGIFIGAWLTSRNQRKQRIVYGKKEEYRDLLHKLTQTLSIISGFHTPISVFTGGEERQYAEAKDEALIAIDTRIFIDDEMQNIDLRNRWLKAVQEVEKDRHGLAFVRTVREITNDIKEAAKQLTD
jgi:hypothetical protein